MRACDVCRIAMNGPDGTTYIVPLNFGLSVDGEKIALYFHSARKGLKLDLLKHDNRVAFEMDRKHQLQYFEDRGYCTFAYESVMGTGTIRMVNGQEKECALGLIMEHYHPGEHAYFNPAAIPITVVYCLEVKTMTGKRKMPKH